MSIFLGYVAYSVYTLPDFIKYFLKVLVGLSSLSLFVWLLAVLFPSPMDAIMDTLSLSPQSVPLRSNVIFVGLGDLRLHSVMGIRRNVGFTWESGRFSCFICIGLLLLFARYKLRIARIFRTKTFIILLLALLSTISTTGICSALVLIPLYMMNHKTIFSKVLPFLISILFLPFLFSLEFMGDKILDLLDYSAEINGMMSVKEGHSMYGGVYTPQRITGLVLAILNWINDFWLGYNLNSQSYCCSVLFPNIQVYLANGNIQLLATIGTIFGFIFYCFLYKSSRILEGNLGIKFSLIFFLLFILINFSYSFWFCPVLSYLIFYSLYSNCSEKR